jgi:hypothetical protein
VYLRDFHGWPGTLYSMFDQQDIAGQTLSSRTCAMKNPIEVLRVKEQEMLKVKKEVDALRITIRLMGEENTAGSDQKVDLRQVIEMP